MGNRKSGVNTNYYIFRGGFGGEIPEPSLGSFWPSEGITNFANCREFCSKILKDKFKNESGAAQVDGIYYARCYQSNENNENLGEDSSSAEMLPQTLLSNMDPSIMELSIMHCIGLPELLHYNLCLFL